MRRKRTNIYGQEEVFIVPYHNTEHISTGFTKQLHTNRVWSQFDKTGKYVYRNDCEGINLFQQIIPYLLIRYEDKYLVEIHEAENAIKMSLGYSTHITRECLTSNKDILFQGALKSLYDNFILERISNPLEVIGTVRDMKESISDHLGIVVLCELSSENEIKYVDKFKSRNIRYEYMDLDKLIEKYGKFESWSKHIINGMIE